MRGISGWKSAIAARIVSRAPATANEDVPAEVPEAAADANAELRQHRGWWLRLAGEGLDLEELERALRGNADVRVERLDGRYWLNAPAIDLEAIEDGQDAERHLEAILKVLNGAARLEHGNAREVRGEAIARVEDDARVTVHAQIATTVRVRSRVAASLSLDGVWQPIAEPESRMSRTTTSGLMDPAAERALRIFGRDDLDYRDLYYIYEIVEEAIDVCAGGTITRAEVSRFKHTAQSPTVLGDTARHGRERTSPPADPMPFPEALELVRRMLRVWLG